MQSIVVELRAVSKVFSHQTALNQIHLQVYSGEFLTLLGPSGCGKTTILRLIAGFESPTSGNILINGQDVQGIPPEHRQVNTVFQSYALFPHMTVFDNVAFGPRIKGIKKSFIRQQVEEILAIVQLQDFADRKPHQLSGGQQQRVAIARAIINKPLVLLLDEPLSALDYKLRKNMQIELKQLQRKLGITFIFITHDQEEALSMSDRVVVMNQGQIEQVGTPKKIYENPSNLFVARFVGESNILRGEVLAVHSTDFEVRLLDKIFSFPMPNNFTPEKYINVLLRPEDLRVYSESKIIDTQETLSGVIEEVIYKGTTVDLLVRLPNGQRLAATEFFDENNTKLDYQNGEKVLIYWIKGWEMILPYE